MNSARPLRSLLLLLCWGYCALSLTGCEIFPSNPEKLANAENGLPAIKVPPDAIELEIMFVERPAGLYAFARERARKRASLMG